MSMKIDNKRYGKAIRQGERGEGARESARPARPTNNYIAVVLANNSRLTQIKDNQ